MAASSAKSGRLVALTVIVAPLLLIRVASVSQKIAALHIEVSLILGSTSIENWSLLADSIVNAADNIVQDVEQLFGWVNESTLLNILALQQIIYVQVL